MDLQNAYSVLLFISLLEKVFLKKKTKTKTNGTYPYTLSLLKSWTQIVVSLGTTHLQQKDFHSPKSATVDFCPQRSNAPAEVLSMKIKKYLYAA